MKTKYPEIEGFCRLRLPCVFAMSYVDLLLPHLGALANSLALSELDVLVNLAERADTLNYVMPTFCDEVSVKIENGVNH